MPRSALFIGSLFGDLVTMAILPLPVIGIVLLYLDVRRKPEGYTTARLPAKVAVPNLIVAGWWDQEDFYGPLKIYQQQKRGDAHGRALPFRPRSGRR